MSTFKVMLVTIATLAFALTGVANAGQSGNNRSAQLQALAHGVTTEGHFYGPQMEAIAQVMANRAYIYGDPDNLRKVVYNDEMRGPIDKPLPLKGGEAVKMERTKVYLSKFFDELVTGKIIAPKFRKAWHFDMSANHPTWGPKIGEVCDPSRKKYACVYFFEAANRKVTRQLDNRSRGVNTASN